MVADASYAFFDGIRGANASIYRAYRAAKVPCFILEMPRLRAGSGRETTRETVYTGIYRHTLHDLPRYIGNRAVVAGLIHGRDPSFALVCGQKPGDTQHGLDAEALARWARQTIMLLRVQYGLPVVYRPHPHAYGEHDPNESFGADVVSLPTTESLRDVLQVAAFVASYNSTSGVDAIDAGVPVFYGAPDRDVSYADYAAPIGAPIRTLTPSEREACLLRFAATQWTQEQLRDGTAVRCLLLGDDWPEPELVTQTEAEDADRRREMVLRAREIANDAARAANSALPFPDPEPIEVAA